MRSKGIYFISLILLLVACSAQENEQHNKYLSEYGWHMKKLLAQETFVLKMPEELLVNYEANELFFFREYEGEEVTQFLYLLKERDTERERLKAVIYECNGEIIGGHGILPNWIPGIFRLEDKERLQEDKKI